MSKGVTYEEYLKEHGTLTYSNVGESMMPLLKQGRDLFTVEEKSEKRCKPGDVVLFKRGGRYVLHRVIKVRDNDYVIMGDNCVSKETGVKDSDIIGVMTAYTRKGKQHKTTDKGYRAYSFIVTHTSSVRAAAKKSVLKLKRILKGKT